LDQDWADSLTASKAKLSRDDPSPVIVANPRGSSPYLLLGDHAGREIPRALGDLGLPPEAMDRHIAWDIGVAALGERLAAALDAAFIRQRYSRLVIDCNRRLGDPTSVPTVSDGQIVPGNRGLGPAGLAARQARVFNPYHAEIARVLDRRMAAGRTTVIIALHSFTPVMEGFARPWRYGVLHRDDSPFSRRVLGALRSRLGDAAGDNQPYAMDGTDNTVPLHADGRGLDYLELEVRQDLIADADGQEAEAAFIAGVFAELAPGIGDGRRPVTPAV
jgi:predicted N-formylglutamate amidohydrolase